MKPVDFYYIISFICLFFYANGQQAPTIGSELLQQLEASVRAGKKKSLRDLGSLLDQPLVNTQARDILKRYTMFSEEEIDWSKEPSKAEFLQFYYNQENQFQFSDLTGNFFLSSLETRKIKSEVKPLDIPDREQLMSSFHQIETTTKQAINNRNTDVLIEQIELLRLMALPNAKQYILDLSDLIRQPKSQKWPASVYQALNKALVSCDDLRSLESVLALLTENHIETSEALHSLSMISNISLPVQSPKRVVLKQYKQYIDSLGTLHDIRMFGYEKLFSFQPSFFNNIVDYYGRVLCFANERQWLVHNAIKDLMRTTHPRALFYLVAVGFKNQYHYPTAPFLMEEAIKLIQLNTHINIGVEDHQRKIQFLGQTNTDRHTQLNYLAYWAINYDDYEWDASRDKFVNKHQALEKTQHYERLFRRLNSRNDSVAISSFKQLTEGDPTEIVSLADKYRQMFRSYNQTLPPFKYKYLEQLAQLTQFCRRYNISYEPKQKLSRLLEDLRASSDRSERYQIENEIIRSLTINDITPLEYWSCLHQENKKNNFSIGRILDIFYSKHWLEIIADDLQLRLYLKKADLLKNIGVIGVCNAYLNKFDLDNITIKERLQQVSSEETDQQIINQIAQLVQFSETDEITAVADFLSSPLYFDKRDINILPAPSTEELAQITKLIKEEEDYNVIKQLFFYLRLHPNLESVPYLFDIASDDRVLVKRRGIELTVADNVTPILESVFNYNFPKTEENKIFDIRPWNTLWDKDKANYTHWPKKFFEETMTILEEQAQLSIDDINLITESPNYDSTYKHFCLKALQKVQPLKDVRSLNIEPKLSAITDLAYFENFGFSYKELDDIPKLFDGGHPELLLNYLVSKAQLFDDDQKGSFYNNMFRHTWFSVYINSGSADLVVIAYIQQVLEKYLNESDYLSEYEEQVTTLHIAQLQNIGKPLEERLLASFDLNADVTAKAKIQETIISTISYADIEIIAKHFEILTTTLGPEPWAFLSLDFGLPVFDLHDKQSYIAFRRNLLDMTEYELYFYYLQQFGVDFLNKKGELDYEKIANILRFDSVTPFVGGGGGKRDYHTYGVIKLLELNFGTRLGYHEKLNENQSFYTFSTAKRSKAWIDFLSEKNLIIPLTDEAPSFNRLIE